jgi:hypothetical protein
VGANEIHYILHACAEHAAAAQAAGAASASGTADGWKAAAEIWKAEVEKLYLKLLDAADGPAKAAVLNDRVMFYAYIGAYEAMRANDPVAAQKAIAEMLRERCGELCCMLHTAPEQLPGSLLNGYANLGGSGKYDACAREIGALQGADSEVTERYDDSHAQVLAEALRLINTTDRYQKDEAFVRVQRNWQIALDAQVNVNYMAADRDARKAIAACRMQLDQVVKARGELLSILYPDAPEVAAEVLANLYRSAAIDACSTK